jgi:hypothetical protein
MQLTLQQITLLTEGTRKLVHQFTVLAEIAEVTGQADMQTLWLNEAEEARQLVHILNDALSIEVESVQLTPAEPPLITLKKRRTALRAAPSGQAPTLTLRAR